MTTVGVIFEKSKRKKNCIPILLPSSISTRPAISSIITSNSGIRILLSRSIPVFTSNHSTAAVSTTGMMLKTTIRGILDDTSTKCADSASVSKPLNTWTTASDR